MDTPVVADTSTAQVAPTTSEFTIPQEYADRGWAKEGKVKSPDDLFKAYDNAQSLLGKRPAGIPANDAPQEEWDKYYNSARPESPDKYDFGKFEGLPEGLDVAPYEAKAKALAHKIGLTSKQAGDMWKEYLSMEIEGVEGFKKQSAEQQAKLDQEFQDLTGKLFGDKYDDVSAKAQEFIKTALPEELRPAIQGLENNPQALVAMIKLAEYSQNEIATIKAKYTGEDSLSGGGGQNAGLTVADIQSKMIEARTKAQKAAPFHPDRAAAEQELNKLREQLSRMSK